MASIFQTIVPALTSRIDTTSSFVVTYDNALDPATILNKNIIFEDAAGLPIAFGLTTNSDDTEITINPTDDLDYNTVYTITMTTGITELASPGAAIDQKEVKFITTEKPGTPDIVLSTDGNVNDVFFKHERLIDIFNIRDVLENGATKYNFALAPSFFDPETNTYATNSTEKLTFDNQSVIKEKFKSQFLSGFTNYLKNLNTFKKISTADLLELEKIIYGSAKQINTASGLIAQLNFLLKAFAETLNYNFVSIEEDPNNRFTYYISTNLPIDHWIGDVKDLVHPVGWQDIYLEIVSPEVKIGIFTVNYKTDIFFLAGHGLAVGQLVHISRVDTLTTLPTPLVEMTSYYILNATTDTFQLSTTTGSGSVVIDLTDNGTGTFELAVLQYFQTEQYAWTDNYLIGTQDNSINRKGFRDGFGVKGQERSYLIERLDSTDPPVVDPPASISSNYKLTAVPNYAYDDIRTLHQVNASDGKIDADGDSILRTDADLSSFSTSELVGDIILIPSGSNKGYYFIQSHTIATTGNKITITTAFPAQEKDMFFDVYNYGTEAEQSKLLAVLNSIRFQNKPKINYIQAREIGENQAVSRLTFDDQGDLQLFHVVGSGLPFTFVEGDTTFQYENDTNPILYLTSTNFVTTSFGFGNVDLSNTVEEITTITLSGTLTIDDIDAPDSQGLQLITFDPADDISAVQATFNLTITGADSSNNGVHPIVDVDYFGGAVTIDNAGGTLESAVSGPTATVSSPTHHFAYTYILPDTFSFDLSLFNGFNVFFNKNRIDPADYFSDCEFLYKYFKFNATVHYPDDSASDWSTFNGDVVDETGENFIAETENGFYKLYDFESGGFEITWAEGNFIYEFDPAGSTSDWLDTDATLSVVSGELVVTNATTTRGIASQVLETLPGRTYRITGNFLGATVAGKITVDSTDIFSSAGATSEAINVIFETSVKSPVLKLTTNSLDATDTSTWDNIKVEEVVDATNSIYGPNLVAGGEFQMNPVGTIFGVVSKLEAPTLGSSNPTGTLIIEFFGSNTDFDDNKYYGNVQRVFGLDTSSGALDTLDKGSDFIDLSTTYDRKIILGFNWADFDSYGWNLSTATETIISDNQLILFGENAVYYDVNLDVQETGSLSGSNSWSVPINLAPTIWQGL